MRSPSVPIATKKKRNYYYRTVSHALLTVGNDSNFRFGYLGRVEEKVGYASLHTCKEQREKK